MPSANVLLAPAVPDLAALGARSAEDLLGLGGGLEGEGRAELLGRERGMSRWRVPLPGTPGPDGRFVGRPRGAGTGWVWVERYERPPLTELLRARFGRPRSTSPAARAWNLLCYLRAQGVATPEPLAVGELGGEPCAPSSVLVVREPTRSRPLPRWWSEGPGRAERRAVARALGELLRRLARAGVVLGELGLGDVHVAERRSAPGAGARSPVPGLRLGGLPELVVAGVRGGRLTGRRGAAGRGELERLALEALRLGGVAPREALAVWYRARGRGLGRRARRAELARLVQRTGRASETRRKPPPAP